MKRSNINTALRDFARTLSPNEQEKALIGDIYKSLCTLFGDSNCIQIGSYPRFTATTPVHDLDVLYCVGNWSDGVYDPEKTLQGARDMIRQSYVSPDGYTVTTELQNHSVVMEFKGPIELSVDIVPCYSFGKNEYGQATYKVPHIITTKDRQQRRQQNWDPSDRNQWISSDPRGYIKQATEVGDNDDFRKTVKIVKHWKRTLRDIDDNLKLKSFHLEQVITRQFQADPGLDILGAIFNFFVALPDTVTQPNTIEDRAQADKYIDDYLVELTDIQIQKITQARDALLIKLEEIDDGSNIGGIFTAELYERDPKEGFMFDFGHTMTVDTDHGFDISYDERDQYENRGTRRARMKNKLPKKKNLFFKIIDGVEHDLTYFWKVQNSKNLNDKTQRRGEITPHQTRNNPENTEYTGEHYVECFGVNILGECVRRARCEVPIGDMNE